jgi:hypothetical protein
VVLSLRASIFVSYKRHTSRFSNCEKSEEADFDTDKRSFAEVAIEILDALDPYVKQTRLSKRRKIGPP